MLDEASLSYMTRTATEARSRATVERITDHVRAERQGGCPINEQKNMSDGQYNGGGHHRGLGEAEHEQG